MWQLLALVSLAGAADETALDRYVRRPDPEYGWKLVSQQRGDGYTFAVLELTSQSWRAADEVDRPVWKHWLSIVRPDKLRHDTGFLFIGGGSNRDPAPTEPTARTKSLALGTGTLVAELGMVPNQPLVFADSPEAARSEDDLIAYTRVRYMDTRDENWLVRLAMVKSGVRAMDALQEFSATPEGGGAKLARFVVAGGSKRGWTTWLVGAVDSRVVAIVPLVIDALNSEEITRHHFEAYGFFSSALDDYVRHGLFPHKVGTPLYREVLAIEDPYHYRGRERLTIPKFLVNAAGDEFFLPDNAQFYYAALPEEKHLRYVPNAKHSLAGSDALESVEAFYTAVLEAHPRPRFHWTKEADGALRVTLDEGRPRAARLWQATNPEARDFRLDTIGPAYQSTELKAEANGEYVARVATPERGFTAYFVELEYASGGRYPLKFTTEVRVLPDRLPYRWEDVLQAR